LLFLIQINRAFICEACQKYAGADKKNLFTAPEAGQQTIGMKPGNL